MAINQDYKFSGNKKIDFSSFGLYNFLTDNLKQRIEIPALQIDCEMLSKVLLTL